MACSGLGVVSEGRGVEVPEGERLRKVRVGLISILVLARFWVGIDRSAINMGRVTSMQTFMIKSLCLKSILRKTKIRRCLSSLNGGSRKGSFLSFICIHSMNFLLALKAKRSIS